MKKAIYLFAATALMTGCNQDVLVEQPQPQPEVNRHIGFDTFVDKATRARGTNSNALNDFYPSFNVYGWKTVGNEVTCVFENVPVSYYDATNANATKPGAEWGDSPETGWYYKYIRYWDKMASAYQFSAYAPVAATDDVNCTPDGTITIGTPEKPIFVEKKNLMDRPSDELAYTGFKFDYMTAQSNSTDANNQVTLNFKHLLAKFNIRLLLDESITTYQDVSVQKVKVHNLSSSAYYTNVENVEGTVSGWTIVGDPAGYTLIADNVYSLNDKKNDNYHNHYVLEQLIIPQTITKFVPQTPETTEDTGDNTGTEEGNDEGTDNEGGEGTEDDTEEPTSSVVPLPVSLTEYEVACVYVEYTIGTEVFKSFTPLSNIFSNDATYNFEGGKQYTLNITIGPKPIEFTAVVTPWEMEVEGDLDMD